MLEEVFEKLSGMDEEAGTPSEWDISIEELFAKEKARNRFIQTIKDAFPETKDSEFVNGNNSHFGNAHVFYFCMDMSGHVVSFDLNSLGTLFVYHQSGYGYNDYADDDIQIIGHAKTAKEAIEKFKELVPVWLAYIRLTGKI